MGLTRQKWEGRIRKRRLSLCQPPLVVWGVVWGLFSGSTREKLSGGGPAVSGLNVFP
jgi:hypothetical protein